MARRTTKTRASSTRRRAKKPAWPTYEIEPRFDPDELRRRLRIDKNALDDEVEQQPEIYGDVGDAAAMAKSQVESLEEQLKELESELDGRIRSDHSDERITENEIKALIAADPRRKEMVIDILNAKHLQRKLEALTTSFRHRSYALRDMVDLYLSSYYSSRSASGTKEAHKDVETERYQENMRERRKSGAKRRRKQTHS